MYELYYHFNFREDRIKLFFNKGEYNEIVLDKISDDPLNFSDKKNIEIDLKNIEIKQAGKMLSFFKWKYI